ncbi:MAG: Nif3-like dinuclear metal center hexameric protein [Syntrophobacterales bacterium]
MRTPVLRLMTATVKDILSCLDAAYPFSWAVPEDRVGLQVGDPGTPVTTVLVALEASLEVVTEAHNQEAQLLLTHHPLLYQPAADIREDRPAGKLLASLVRAGIAVAACHTNLDLAPRGLNEHLAQELGLMDLEVLSPVRRDAWLKLTVFVPVGYEDQVRAALVDDRVGVIGRYSHCSFAARGQGTYLPLEGARPFRGEVAALSRAEESRLEVAVPESCVRPALARLKTAHPYEEVAYDLYPLVDSGPILGFGRVGRWPQALSWEEVVRRVKTVFAVSGVRVWGRPPAAVSRVAVCGGSGGDLIGPAQQKGAAVYVTGEVRHHQAVPRPSEEFAIIEVGHFASEVVFMPAWAEQVAGLLQEDGLEVQVRTVVGETPPFQVI